MTDRNVEFVLTREVMDYAGYDREGNVLTVLVDGIHFDTVYPSEGAVDLVKDRVRQQVEDANYEYEQYVDSLIQIDNGKFEGQMLDLLADQFFYETQFG